VFVRYANCVRSRDPTYSKSEPGRERPWSSVRRIFRPYFTDNETGRRRDRRYETFADDDESITGGGGGGSPTVKQRRVNTKYGPTVAKPTNTI